MNDFFDKNLLQNIIVSVFILLVSILLGARTKKSQSISISGKDWKILIIISWIMILGGLYLFIENYTYGDFNNPYLVVGFSCLFFGGKG